MQQIHSGRSWFTKGRDGCPGLYVSRLHLAGLGAADRANGLGRLGEGAALQRQRPTIVATGSKEWINQRNSSINYTNSYDFEEIIVDERRAVYLMIYIFLYYYNIL